VVILCRDIAVDRGLVGGEMGAVLLLRPERFRKPFRSAGVWRARAVRGKS
jgi:hypothetical protein